MNQDEIFAALRELATRDAGKSAAHDFFRAVHQQALRGMGLVNDASVAQNGEAGALRYVNAMLARQGVAAPVIFDVGANCGEYAQAALAACPAATVFAFEPSPVAYGQLTALAAAHPGRLRPFNVGFSDQAGTAALHAAAAGSTMGSLYRRDAHGPAAAASTETIRLETIDGFCRAHGLERVHFLKLDVEGHELAALRGAESLLRGGGVNFIQFEFGGCSMDARVFLRDFARLLPDYVFCRILRDGLYQFQGFTEFDEIFAYQNFLAMKK